MPGGKITEIQDLPDLESYLARKRYPLDKWLVVNNITSPAALTSLVSSNKWIITPKLHHLIHELVKPVYIPLAPTAEAVTAPVSVVAEHIEPVLKQEPAIKQESTVEQVIEKQTNLDIEDQVVSEPEEPNQMVEEASMVSSQSFRERKRNRLS